MRIALISTPFVAVPPPAYGGTELVVSELAAGLVARGHLVTVFATGDSTTPATLRSLYARAQWPPDTLADLNHVTWAMHRIAAGGFDVVHAHSAVALAAGRLLPEPPLVYTIHHEREPSLSALYAFFPGVQYVAISADQRARETPLAECAVVHHGLDPSRYACRAEVGDRVCFVGRLADVKGPHRAIDAAALAGVPIDVAGDVHPPDRAFAERELHERLRHPHVRWLGSIGPDRKVPLLRDARAVLAPIAWNEPFGLILIEAMLSGCPPIAFRRGSAPELIEHGVTGYLVDTIDDIAAIIRPGGDVERFDRVRCRARAVERFGRDRMTADYERVYRRVIARRSVAARPHRRRTAAHDGDVSVAIGS
jgi:glycosyltransferase involved in cell wall biosynthesis